MPTTVVVRFPLGRYHATPWSRHVNEGAVELPPSPWRVLRALYAVWKTRRPDLQADVAESLLRRLADPPTYFVPPYRLGHTRHYYPDEAHRSGSSSTDRTLDAYALLDQAAELGIRWPGDLAVEEWKALDQLVSALPYLGRADSVCEARLDDNWLPNERHVVCGPVDVGESVPLDQPAVSLLCAEAPLDLVALVQRPVDVLAQKVRFPSHTRLVGYLAPRPDDRPVHRARPRRAVAPIDAVRYQIISPLRPRAEQSVAMADRLRGAAVRRLNERREHALEFSTLVGRGSDGAVALGHRHAHYLAVPHVEGRVIDVAVWSPQGFGPDEIEALDGVRRLWAPEGAGGPGPLSVRITAYGVVADVLPELVRPSTTWVSATPFSTSRHPKRDLEGFLRGELARELDFRDLPAPLSVEIDATRDPRGYIRFRPSQRFSKRQPDVRAARPAWFLRMTFDRPIAGPVVLGHLSHFGLGVFQPASLLP